MGEFWYFLTILGYLKGLSHVLYPDIGYDGKWGWGLHEKAGKCVRFLGRGLLHTF